MQITRRDFGKAAIALGLTSLVGCISSKQEPDPKKKEVTAEPKIITFQELVQINYDSFSNRFEGLDRSKSIAVLALDIEEASPETYEKLESLMERVLEAIAAKDTPEEKLGAKQRFLAKHRPYKKILIVREVVEGQFSDCDTRSILLLDANERERLQKKSNLELSLVIVPNHAYLRLNHDPKRNWETTVSDGHLFDMQDYLDPQELSREDVILQCAIWQAIHERGIALQDDYEDDRISLLAKSTATTRYVLEHAQSKHVKSIAAHTLATSIKIASMLLEDDSLLEKAREFYKEGFEYVKDPDFLIGLASTYPVEGYNLEARGHLNQAAEAINQHEENAMKILEKNPVLFAKKMLEYNKKTIIIYERLKELNPELKEVYDMMIKASQQSKKAFQKSYEALLQVRVLTTPR